MLPICNLFTDESGKLGGIFSTVPTAPEGKTGRELWHLMVGVADPELKRLPCPNPNPVSSCLKFGSFLTISFVNHCYN